MLPWLAAAASLAAAVGASVFYVGERGERLALEDELRILETTVADRDAAVAARDSLLENLLGPDVRTATLAASGSAPSMRLFWNRDRDRVVLVAFDLPPAPSGRTYQLWGIGDAGNPVSLGTFDTDASGRALVGRPVPADAEFTVSAVTEEPAGGSPQPTTTPFLVGSWRSAD